MDKKNILASLKERAKELNCMYRIEDILKNNEKELKSIFHDVLREIPPGWQYPEICRAKIIYQEKIYRYMYFEDTKWKQSANIIVDNNMTGKILVYYTERPSGSECVFLPHEQKLLNNIANRLSNYIFHKKLNNTLLYLDETNQSPEMEMNNILSPASDEHWKWRKRIAEIMTKKLDFHKFAVKAVYLIGSTKNATAGPASDIDLMVHSVGTSEQKKALKAWFDGWGLCLAEMNFTKTGCKTKESLIDLHIFDDKDIEKPDSFTAMITSKHDKALLLRGETL